MIHGSSFFFFSPSSTSASIPGCSASQTRTTPAARCSHYPSITNRPSTIAPTKGKWSLCISMSHWISRSTTVVTQRSAMNAVMNGIMPFPYKVAKVLDPESFR